MLARTSYRCTTQPREVAPDVFVWEGGHLLVYTGDHPEAQAPDCLCGAPLVPEVDDHG